MRRDVRTYVELDVPLIKISHMIHSLKEEVRVEDSECSKQGLHAVSNVLVPEEKSRGGDHAATSIIIITQKRVEPLRVEWLKHADTLFRVDVRCSRSFVAAVLIATKLATALHALAALRGFYEGDVC